MRKFTLTGTFSSFNKGDAAMELCATQQLQEQFENAAVTIASPFPEIDKPFYSEAEVVKSKRRSLIRGSLQVARAFAWRTLKEGIGLDSKLLLGGDPETRSMLESDVVIDLSGDMLTEDYGPHVAYSHFLPLLLAFALNKKVFVCAQSIGPFSLTSPLARWVLDHADAVTVRDEVTLEHLQKLGLQNLPQVTADLAFLLRPAPAERVQQIFEKEGLPAEKGQRWLGISLSQLCEKHYQRSHESEGQDGFKKLMVDVLDRIMSQQDVNLMFVSHVTGPRAEHDDRIISREVKERLKESNRAFVLEGDYRPDELKGVISKCETFMGCRMHANIAALSSCVPLIAIAYSHKAPGIMQLFGQRNRALPIAELGAEGLNRELDILFAEKETIRQTLSDHLQTVKSRATENLQIVAKLCSETQS